MSWAQLSAIMEPIAFFRRIYGFDTFEGFPSVSNQDLEGKSDLDWKSGDLKDESYYDLQKCIELFLPRMTKGSILAFDEINNPMWPGETTAFLEALNIRELQVRKFPYEPNMAYIVF